MSKKILVGLSGGVDSAVAAALLQEQGYDVACGFMINYLEEENPECSTREDLAEAKKVATFLGLPLFTFDYQKEYEERIIDYIYREYERGHTPNPDVFCNNLIKFDLFLEEARHLGYDAIATGHYARREGTILLKGKDARKDQSYFLSRLTPHELSGALFPIGAMQKHEVRAFAKKKGLPNALRKDSQGLCFIGKIPMKAFLARKIPKKPGNILDIHGNILGHHTGVFNYTIGQRKGIEIGGGPALFVLKKDIQHNTLIVGEADDALLYSKECILTDWVGRDIHPDRHYSAKIRYRQEDQPCHITQKGVQLCLHFEHPQRAIASGQIGVIYDGDAVVGSGIIYSEDLSSL